MKLSTRRVVAVLGSALFGLGAGTGALTPVAQAATPATLTGAVASRVVPGSTDSTDLSSDLSSGPSSGPIRQTDIVGGVPATQVYPWMAKLKMVYGTTGVASGCGGTMLSRDIILTAQHCTMDDDQYGPVTRVTAYIGANTYRNGTMRTSNSTSLWRTGGGPKNGDWAIIKLDQPYDVPGGYPLLASGTAYDFGPTYRALGWGRTYEGATTGVDDLRQVDLPFVPDSQCGTYTSQEICAGDYLNGGIDTCAGDSGGPLLKQEAIGWVQVGVTSWGAGCARARMPGHYAQVSTYVGSIQSAISQLGGQPARTTANPGTSVPTPTYTSTPTATATSTATATATSIPTSPGGTVLTNNVPVTVSGASGSFVVWTIDVPAGASSLVVSSSGGTGDMDLYVKAGTAPSTSVYDCRSLGGTATESCTISFPTAGRYYVGLRGYTAFSGVTLKASYAASSTSTPTYTPTSPSTSTPTSNPGDPLLLNGVPVSLSGSYGATTYYAVQMPSGTSSLTVATSGGSGDLDLYVKQGSRPTSTIYDCRSIGATATETCTISSPSVGTYYVRLYGYTSYSGVSLVARW